MKVALVFTLVFVVIVSFVAAAPKKENCWDCSCTKSYDPVCGSNDETYSNKCTLTCAQGCNPKIKLLHKGQCGSLKDTEETTLAAEAVTEKAQADVADDDAEAVKEAAEEEEVAKIVEEIMMVEAETTVKSQSADDVEQTTTKN